MSRRRGSRGPLRVRVRRTASRYVRPLVSALVLGAGLLLCGAFVGVAVQQTAVAREARSMQQGITTEQARNADLKAEIAKRQTDAYVVDRARDLGYVRPGESLIAIQGSGDVSAQVGAMVSASGDRLARWVALFLGPK